MANNAKARILTRFLFFVLLTGAVAVQCVVPGYAGDVSAGLPVEPRIFEVTGEETDPVAVMFSNGVKTVTYIPMIHIGTPVFYAAVADKVKAEKKKGAVLYYEYIDFDVLNDDDKRKVRSIVGLLPTPDMYDSVSGDGYIGQPNDDFLGLVNDRDFNIDLTAEGLIEACEAEFGPVEIFEADLTSDLSEFATKVEPPDNVNKVVFEQHNRLVVDAIVNGSHDRIVMLYGEAHGPGIYAGLQASDPAWKRVR